MAATDTHVLVSDNANSFKRVADTLGVAHQV